MHDTQERELVRRCYREAIGLLVAAQESLAPIHEMYGTDASASLFIKVREELRERRDSLLRMITARITA
jgi:hypothetical protein